MLGQIPVVDKLLDKAKESFVMAIELYNKPTIRYRVEGFSFFICNAWELMLKAHMVKGAGEQAIYYPDNPSRTLSLEVCVRKVFTNEKAPLRKNLEKIIELRNTSTHFIVEEYEMVYIPLFQACIFNFIEKMQEFHGIDMTQIIPQNFVTLAVSMRALNEAEIRGKYSDQVAEKLLRSHAEIVALIDANNDNFAIRIDHYHYMTKDKSKATEFFHIEKGAPEGVQIIKELKDPNDTHKYTMKAVLREVNARLSRAHISLMDKDGAPCQFNSFHFGLFCKYFGIKSDPKLCYTYRVTTQPSYSYSLRAIDFIVEEIKKDPEHIVQNLHEKVKAKK